MPKNWRRSSIWLLLAVGLVSGLLYGFWPTPVSVESRTVELGTLTIAVEDDGITRIKEKYIVSSPLAGRMGRVQLHPGDAIEAGVTVLASLDPAPATLLDARTRAEAKTKLSAAQSAHKRAAVLVDTAHDAEVFASEEFDRAKKLSASKSISHEEIDRAELKWLSAQRAYQAAQLAVQIAEFEVGLAQASLLHVSRAEDEGQADAADWRIEIKAPITGQVLRVFQESAALVEAGTDLMEVGDPTDLEVVVDALSSDAVKVAPGNRVVLDDWGGPHPLKGRVRVVEPSGFMKVSALGVEEQRVNVIIDLTTPLEERRTLGDDFRVEAKIVIEQGEGVLKVPTSALMQHGEKAVVFVVDRAAARLQNVRIGRRGRLEAEVLDGLQAGQKVIVFPSDKVQDGVTVQER